MENHWRVVSRFKRTTLAIFLRKNCRGKGKQYRYQLADYLSNTGKGITHDGNVEKWSDSEVRDGLLLYWVWG